jgi:hypothetical protein
MTRDASTRCAGPRAWLGIGSLRARSENRRPRRGRPLSVHVGGAQGRAQQDHECCRDCDKSRRRHEQSQCRSHGSGCPSCHSKLAGQVTRAVSARPTAGHMGSDQGVLVYKTEGTYQSWTEKVFGYNVERPGGEWKKPGLLGGHLARFGAEAVVEDSGADDGDAVGSARRPAHAPLLRHPCICNFVDAAFCPRRRDRLT